MSSTWINVRDYLHVREEIDCSKEIGLTQDQRDEILEAFTLYDTDKDGLIETRNLGTVIRSLGQIPTVCEETDVVARFAQEKCYEIDYLAFVRLMTAIYKCFDEEEELRESFRRFDKEENGFVNCSDLRSMLTTIGEPLTEEEVDDWLEDAKPFIRRGNLHYEEFATFMLSK